LKGVPSNVTRAGRLRESRIGSPNEIRNEETEMATQVTHDTTVAEAPHEQIRQFEGFEHKKNVAMTIHT
jgi:hypothetical protein